MYCYLLINLSDVINDATECHSVTQGELKIKLCKDNIPLHHI